MIKHARSAVLLLFWLSFTIAPLLAADWGSAILEGLSKGAEGMAEHYEREAEIQRRLEAEKELMDHQYELERQRMREQMELERQQKQAEMVRERKRMEEEYQNKVAEDERKRKETEDARRNAINTGTGFFVSSDGYVVTNYHVVEDKSDYSVRDRTGKFYEAKLIAADAGRDIAVLKIDGKFPSLKIGNSDKVTKGQRMFAVGYPQIQIQGNESKVTDGVISSFSGIRNDPNWFQISIPIQGGNSGGPMVDEKGVVYGIVVATANAARFFRETGNMPQNINYAIKSNVLSAFLKEHGIKNIAGKAKADVEYVDGSTALIVAGNQPVTEQNKNDKLSEIKPDTSKKKEIGNNGKTSNVPADDGNLGITNDRGDEDSSLRKKNNIVWTGLLYLDDLRKQFSGSVSQQNEAEFMFVNEAGVNLLIKGTPCDGNEHEATVSYNKNGKEKAEEVYLHFSYTHSRNLKKTICSSSLENKISGRSIGVISLDRVFPYSVSP